MKLYWKERLMNLIAKELVAPLRLLALEALLRRLEPDSPLQPQLNSEILRRRAGYHGERSIRFYLEQLPDKETYIFHNLRMEMGSFFEMDVLILNRYYALILETKSLGGEIHLDSQFGQLIRTRHDGKKYAYSDPLEQVNRHTYLLNNWFNEHLGYTMPIEQLVIVSNPSTIITTDAGKAHLYKKVIHSNKLLSRIRDLDRKLRVEISDLSQLKKTRGKLLRAHREPEIDILGKLNLTGDNLLKGVQCPACKRFDMLRRNRRWECPHCGKHDRNAHLLGIQDYFLLMGNTITNGELRKFLNISDVYVANKLLRGLGLESSGERKSKKYHAPKNFHAYFKIGQ